jgi:hypothetical protein
MMNSVSETAGVATELQRTPRKKEACWTRSPSNTVTGSVVAVTDSVNRGSSVGPRKCLAEEFLRQYQSDMLSLVEQMRALSRTRRERGER